MRNQKPKIMFKKETKANNKRQCTLSPVQVQDPRRQSRWNWKKLWM